jgi:sulfur carrier protein
MKITLNNRNEEIQKENLSIKELLVLKNFTFANLVIKVNGKLIKKDAYTTQEIQEGDIVDVIHMISGG